MAKAKAGAGWWRWRALLAFAGLMVLLQLGTRWAGRSMAMADRTTFAILALALGLAGALVFFIAWSKGIVRAATPTDPDQGVWAGSLEFGCRWVMAHLSSRPQAESWFRWGLRAPYRDQALAYMARAARGSHPEAHFELGLHQEQGEWGLGGRQAAATHYLAAARLGHGEAAFRLAEILRWETGPSRDPEGALRWYLHSARLGFAPAMAWLAHAYATGDGGPADPGKAAHWQALSAAQPAGTGLRRSALAGIPGGEDEPLARLRRGVREGVEDGAQALLEIPGFGATAAGLTVAVLVLGPIALAVFLALLVRNGGAFGLIAAVPGVVAFAGLALLHLRQHRGMRMSRQGRRLEAAARKGDAEACYRMGMNLARGNPDVPQDTIAARQWFLRAAQAGHLEGMVEAGEALSWGVGGLPDRKAGRAWLERAAAAGHAGAQDRLDRAPAPEPQSGAAAHPVRKA